MVTLSEQHHLAVLIFCIIYFSPCCDKQLKGERFISAYRLKEYSPTMKEAWQLETAGHIASSQKEKEAET